MLDAMFDVGAPVVAFCVQRIVRLAEQHDVVRAGCAAAFEWHHVVELQPTACPTVLTVDAHEATLPGISPHALQPSAAGRKNLVWKRTTHDTPSSLEVDQLASPGLAGRQSSAATPEAPKRFQIAFGRGAYKTS